MTAALAVWAVLATLCALGYRKLWKRAFVATAARRVIVIERERAVPKYGEHPLVRILAAAAVEPLN